MHSQASIAHNILDSNPAGKQFPTLSAPAEEIHESSTPNPMENSPKKYKTLKRNVFPCYSGFTNQRSRCNLSCLAVPSTSRTIPEACLECIQKGPVTPASPAVAPIVNVPTSFEELATVAWLGASASPQASTSLVQALDFPVSGSIPSPTEYEDSFVDPSAAVPPDLTNRSKEHAEDNDSDNISISSGNTLSSPTNASLRSRPLNGGNRQFALQWNVNGLRSRTSELQLLLAAHSPSVIALQETGTRDPPINSGQLNQYNWYFQNHNTTFRHGVSVAVKKSIPSSRITISTPIEVSAVRIEGYLNVSVASIYLPHTCDFDVPSELNRLLNQLPKPVLLLGDFNGHHSAWGEERENTRGRKVLEFAVEGDLIILNNGNHTFVHRGTGASSAIDLSIASNDFAHKVDWLVDKDTRSSDHYPIYLNTFTPEPTITARRRWKYEEADWEGFQARILELLPDDCSPSLELITEAITKAAEENIPRSSGQPGRGSVPWWKPELKPLLRARRKALRKLRKTPKDSPLWAERLTRFQAARSAASTEVKKAKHDSWEKFLDGISPDSSTQELWRRVNAVSGKKRKQSLAMHIDGEYTDDPLTVANYLADHFQSVSADSSYSSTFREAKEAEERQLDMSTIDELPFNTDFSLPELEWALRKGRGKSTGPDNLGYPLFRNLPLQSRQALLNAFNCSWRNGDFGARVF